MVRTKADGGSSSASRKVVAARAPRKALGGSGPSSSASNSPSGKSAKYAGGNSVCPRPTPDWQKGINSFFQSPQKGKENQSPSDLESAGAAVARAVHPPHRPAQTLDRLVVLMTDGKAVQTTLKH